MNSIAVAMFWFSSIWILPFWVLMWFLPEHDLTKRFVGNLRWSVYPLLIPYAILAIPNAPDILFTFASEMPTPESVVELFADDEVVVLAWLHMLAFDLFIGRYVWLRMLAAKRPVYVSTPILFLCMMMAPLGFLLGIMATWNHEEIPSFSPENESNSSPEV